METPIKNAKMKCAILQAKAMALYEEICLLAKEYEDANESPEPLEALKSSALHALTCSKSLERIVEILWN